MRHAYLILLSGLLFMIIGAGYGKSNIMEKQTGNSLPTLEIEGTAVKSSQGAPVEKKDNACSNLPYHPFTIHLEMNMYRDSAMFSASNYTNKIGQAFITRSLIANATWYSVDHGSFKTAKAAVTTMNELKSQGLIPKDAYVGVPVPYTVELSVSDSKEKALKDLSRARKAGISAYMIQKKETCFVVLSGAFPNKDTAASLLKEIRNLGLEARVAPR